MIRPAPAQTLWRFASGGLLAASTLLAAGSAAGAAPILHETKTVTLAASPAKVWAVIDKFSDITWVTPVKSSTATQGNTPGSVRTIDLGGPKLIERLKAYSATQMRYSYVITNDPANVKTLPVTDYSSTISVKAAGKGSLVTWTGRFKRADQGDKPSATTDDKAATAAVAGVYDAGFSGLKAKVGG